MSLSRSMALRLATEGIRCNVVCPGAILTPMLERHLSAGGPQARDRNVARYEQVIAMRRLGEPREVADVVVWLCSDAASYVTGQVLNVDGALGM